MNLAKILPLIFNLVCVSVLLISIVPKTFNILKFGMFINCFLLNSKPIFGDYKHYICEMDLEKMFGIYSSFILAPMLYKGNGDEIYLPAITTTNMVSKF